MHEGVDASIKMRGTLSCRTRYDTTIDGFSQCEEYSRSCNAFVNRVTGAIATNIARVCCVCQSV